jgi:hypothetical protein
MSSFRLKVFEYKSLRRAQWQSRRPTGRWHARTGLRARRQHSGPGRARRVAHRLRSGGKAAVSQTDRRRILAAAHSGAHS